MARGKAGIGEVGTGGATWWGGTTLDLLLPPETEFQSIFIVGAVDRVLLLEKCSSNVEQEIGEGATKHGEEDSGTVQESCRGRVRAEFERAEGWGELIVMI